MMRALEIIFFILLVFYLLRIIGTMALRGWINNKSREYQGYDRRRQQRQPRRPREGEVTVERDGRERQKKIAKDVGDYVDYEEIKEK